MAALLCGQPLATMRMVNQRRRLAATEARVLNRITTDDRTSHAIQRVMHPGLVMHVTDAAAPDTTRSGRSFVIATHHEPEDWKTKVLRN